MPWVAAEIPRLAQSLNLAGLLVALICGLVAWVPVLRLWPSPDDTKGFDGRHGIGLAATGLIIWMIGCVLAWWQPHVGLFGPGPIDLVPLLGAAVFLFGLRIVVVAVGIRSRVFRTDRIRRQRIRDLVVGIGFIGLGVLLTWLGEGVAGGNAPGWLTLGQFTFTGKAVSGLAFVGMAMSIVASMLVLVGLIYLCFNSGLGTDSTAVAPSAAP